MYWVLAIDVFLIIFAKTMVRILGCDLSENT